MKSTVPVPRSTFVGRGTEVSSTHAALARARMVTLTGPGGAGKTRIALEVARSFEGLAVFVDLTPVRGDDPVDQIVAGVLGCERAGVPGLESIADALRGERVLLVLDNCEQVVSGAAALSEALLGRCPDLLVLATSRERLHIEGEQILPVPPMAHPDPRELGPVGTVLGYEAIALFCERARAVDPAFEPTERIVAVVARICHRLDGMPLAIELAAARTAVLGVEQILDRLAERFTLLSAGSRTAQARQKTLQAAIDWSYDLLDPNEQAILCKMGVFPATFEIEAAEAVAGASLDTIASLVDRSLLVVERREGRARYRLLESIREYARERNADLEQTRAALLSWCEQLAEQAHEALRGTDQQAWLDRLDDEHDSMREALRWALATERFEQASRLASAMTDYWRIRGHYAEGLRWLRAIPDVGLPERMRASLFHDLATLTQPAGAFDETAERAEAAAKIYGSLGDRLLHASSLMTAADAYDSLGQFDHAMSLAQTALTIHTDLDHVEGIGRAQFLLGMIALRLGEFGEARERVGVASDIYERLSIASRRAACVYALGRIEYEEGDYARAASIFRRALDMAESLGDPQLTAACLAGLAGSALFGDGDPADAETTLRESLVIAERIGDRHMVGRLLTGLARAQVAQGRIADAAGTLLDAIANDERLGDATTPANAAWVAATFALAAGDTERAAELFGSTEAVMRSLGTTIADNDKTQPEWIEARTSLGADRLEQIVDRFGRRSLEEAVDAVKTYLREAAASAPVKTKTKPVQEGAHIVREGEVWEIGFAGRTLRFRHTKGFTYIARLVAEPGREFHVLDLIDAPDRAGVTTPAMDDRARRELGARIEDLDEQVREAESWGDPERAAAAKEELEQIATRLAADHGLGGRPRALDDPAERARKAVTNRIKDALARIKTEDEELAGHLARALRTGTFCSYAPAGAVKWAVQAQPSSLTQV